MFWLYNQLHLWSMLFGIYFVSTADGRVLPSSRVTVILPLPRCLGGNARGSYVHPRPSAIQTRRCRFQSGGQFFVLLVFLWWNALAKREKPPFRRLLLFPANRASPEAAWLESPPAPWAASRASLGPGASSHALGMRRGQAAPSRPSRLFQRVPSWTPSFSLWQRRASSKLTHFFSLFFMEASSWLRSPPKQLLLQT